MTPEQIDRVFGRARLKMVTGEHVEVFREAAGAGDRRRYTKRFLNTLDVDFGQWTEREWRILARLIGHGIDCVPEVVQFDRATQLVQTYDAGATVDQWATILPVSRGGHVLRHVFEDCAHWWALAHHCLRALAKIHELSVVHLDIKGDNVCIPVGPSNFDPNGRGLRLYPRFGELALIDFAFALVSRESLTTALPIGWQTDYDYQSPRLLSALEAGRRGDLQPTRELDWRCDMYSLAAMLKRYLPEEDAVFDDTRATGWSLARAAAAKELILALRDAHDRDATLRRPHQDLIASTAAHLEEADMHASLQAGWTLARDAIVTPVAASPLTPLTRLAPSIRVFVSPRAIHPITAPPTVIRRRAPAAPPSPARKPRAPAKAVVAAVVVAIVAAASAPLVYDRISPRAAPEAPPEHVAQAPRPQTPEPSKEEAAQPEPATAQTDTSAKAPPPRTTTNATRARPSRSVAETPRAPAKPTPPIVAKAPPAQVAASRPAPAPPRVRFHEEAPVASPGAPPANADPANTISIVASPQPEPAPPAIVEKPAVTPPPSEPPRVAQSPPPQSSTQRASRLELVPEIRNLLSFISSFAKRRDHTVAPIEDRNERAKPIPAPVEPAYAAAPPAVVAPLPTPEAPPIAAQASREPAPRAMPPSELLVSQARRTLSESVPQSAARAEVEIARVLWVAANATQASQEREIADAARRAWPGNVSLPGSGFSPAVARQLTEDARQAFMVQKDVTGAFDLQLRAFGANPRDAEAAGNLAFLYLKLRPPQAETARQVAMHAISIGSGAGRPTRVEDWNTFAVASALTGRERDATHAFFVSMALTRNLDRTCRSALGAVDSFGDRLIVPVQAMMMRIRQQGREYESPYCTWPSRWQSAKGF
jgi:hypothetical protein